MSAGTRPHGISPQSLVEHALAASISDDCVAIVRDSTSANLRWANNTLTTNGVMHGVHVAAHIKGAELKLIPGLAHRFQEAFKEPLLAAVLPYLNAHRQAVGLARL